MGVLVTVMGIDIKPGYSPRSSRTPRYAAVVLRDGQVIGKLDDVPLYTIIRYIIEYHVDMLAVDSIFELVGSSKDMARLSKVIPSWCKVVEVTGTDAGFISTEELAKLLDLKERPSTPLETALINAYAAYKGYGRAVKLPPERVYVVVSKGRTPSQGGASSERFKRSVRASVLQLVREVQKALESCNLDYDLVVKRSDGGLERGLFIVYAPLEKVREAVSPIRYKNARITIKPISSLKPQTRLRRAVILGVDPGSSVGVAVLDFDGKPLLVKSYKNPDREQIISEVLEVGKPAIVAVDTAKPPEYARKIATALGAKLYSPEEDLSLEEKQRVASEFSAQFSVDVPDSHTRDALAAALKAYRQIKPLVEEVESKIRGISGLNRDEVVLRVLQGKALSEVLEEEFLSVLTDKKTPLSYVSAGVREEHTRNNEDALRLQSRIAELESTVKRLEEEIRRRDELIERLEVELKLLKKRSLGEECERRLNQLQVELETLRRLLDDKSSLVESLKSRIASLEKLIVDVATGRLTLACKPQSLSNCKGMPVYVERESDLYRCIEYAKASRTGVLVPTGLSIPGWEELRVPVLEVRISLDLGDYVLVDSSVLESIKSTWTKIGEIESRERRERIIKMIREYQEARKGGLSRE